MKTAAFARDIIATMERETKSKAARIRMAQINITNASYDADAQLVWAGYLAALEA